MSNITTPSSPTPSQPSTIFPMHILGGGSIGLLCASTIHCAYNEMRDRGDVHSSHGSYAMRGGGLSYPVTLLMRSHHKPHLRRTFDENQACRSQWFAPVELCGTSKDNADVNVVRRCDIPVELIETNTAEDGTHKLQNHENSPIQCLLLCTKANDAIPALNSVWDRLISSSLSSPAKVIILSNGALAIRDAIYKHLGGHIAGPGTHTFDQRVQIVLATTTHGAYKTQSSQSTNNGENIVGHYSSTHAGEGSTHCTNEEFIHMCQSIGWKSAVLSDFDMNVMLWKKLAVNCVINPLTALNDVKNGQLLECKHMGQDIKVITRQLLEEVSLVALMEMEILFEETMKNDGDDSKNIKWLQSTREQLSVSSLEAFVFKVMSGTANNISSMLQDVRANRTTEVRYLNGYVSCLGQEKYGLECPRNMEMCQLVEDLLP